MHPASNKRPPQISAYSQGPNKYGKHASALLQQLFAQSYTTWLSRQNMSRLLLKKHKTYEVVCYTRNFTVLLSCSEFYKFIATVIFFSQGQI